MLLSASSLVKGHLFQEELSQSLPIEVVFLELYLDLCRSTNFFFLLLDFLEEWVIQSFVY